MKASYVGLFSIFDQVAGLSSNPFCAKSVGEAVRNFRELVNDERTLIHKYPTDYSMRCVGVFDVERGYLFGYAGPDGPSSFDAFDFKANYPAESLLDKPREESPVPVAPKS